MVGRTGGTFLNNLDLCPCPVNPHTGSRPRHCPDVAPHEACWGECRCQSLYLSTEFAAAGVSYSVLFGGDFNEDIYGRNSRSDQPQCELVTSSLANSKFASIGIDVAAACQNGKIGQPKHNWCCGRWIPKNWIRPSRRCTPCG